MLQRAEPSTASPLLLVKQSCRFSHTAPQSSAPMGCITRVQEPATKRLLKSSPIIALNQHVAVSAARKMTVNMPPREREAGVLFWQQPTVRAAQEHCKARYSHLPYTVPTTKLSGRYKMCGIILRAQTCLGKTQILSKRVRKKQNTF